MISTTTATTSKRWIRLPAMWKLKPSSHKISKITNTVQSIEAPFCAENARQTAASSHPVIPANVSGHCDCRQPQRSKTLVRTTRTPKMPRKSRRAPAAVAFTAVNCWRRRPEPSHFSRHRGMSWPLPAQPLRREESGASAHRAHTSLLWNRCPGEWPRPSV